ncbi:P-loop NTPase fold protein [Cellulosimicrobium sp. RS]|uniref:KAP family P-loop NTPase fold protein n=1 Tax=Cellulosimicrobium sp. RS TaxID=3381347 RepID=UPI0038FCF869
MKHEVGAATLAGQLWSDEPATVDFLAARAIAETVADAVLDDALDPLSLGLSGPWGSGKTTVLKLVEEELNDRSTGDDKVVVVPTDPWRYDPSVGAKESIIAAVLDALSGELREIVVQEAAEGGGKMRRAKDLLARLSKRVDWAKAVKLAATTTLALQLPSVDDLTSLIKDPPDESGVEDERGLAGFHEEFQALLASPELAHVRRVAVLVDDLDRCLSRTVVESLEAIRLFLSVPKMAFVIAADEDRVADAIKSELPAWTMPEERPGGPDALPPEPPWKLYLHKIVQTTVPLPALGSFDTEAYLLLLQVHNRAESKLEPAQLDALIMQCSELRKSGSLDELKAEDGLDFQSELAFAHRLTAILYEKLAGNPRRIKRFLNDLNIRRSIARRRGIDLDADVVAKLMVLEVLLPENFTEILSWLRTGELRDRLGALEKVAKNDRDETTQSDTDSSPQRTPFSAVTPTSEANPVEPGQAEPAGTAGTSGVESEGDEAKPKREAVSAAPADPVTIAFNDDLIRWAKLDPPLAEVELSPYLHLAASFSGDLLVSNELPARLRDVAAALMSIGPIGREAADKHAVALPVQDAQLLLAHLARRARDRIPDQRGAVSGICRLVRAHASLASAAVDAFKRIPPKDLQVPTVIMLRAQDFDGMSTLIADLVTRTEGKVRDALTAATPGRRN